MAQWTRRRICCRRRQVIELDEATDAMDATKAAPIAKENQLVFHTAECSVCLGHFEEGKAAIRLNCGHLFHEGCIRSWLGVRDACPFCNTAGARGTMRDVQVALINDPTRLHELNMYVAKGAMPVLCMWNASLVLTKDGREILLQLFIRRFLLRLFRDRFPNLSRVMTFVVVFFVCLAAQLLARSANDILQKGIRFAFKSFGQGSFLREVEYIGRYVQPVLILLPALMSLTMLCIELRASTIKPAPLKGEFQPENVYVIPGQQEEQLTIKDVTDAEIPQQEQPTIEDMMEIEGEHPDSMASYTSITNIQEACRLVI